jgi:hypothetical protein
MKLKIGYTIDNRQVNNEVTINQFPASYWIVYILRTSIIIMIVRRQFKICEHSNFYKMFKNSLKFKVIFLNIFC